MILLFLKPGIDNLKKVYNSTPDFCDEKAQEDVARQLYEVRTLSHVCMSFFQARQNLKLFARVCACHCVYMSLCVCTCVAVSRMHLCVLVCVCVCSFILLQMKQLKILIANDTVRCYDELAQG